MTARSQITMDSALQRRARKRAAELGVSFAEYVRRVVSQDLGEKHLKRDVSILFNLVEGGASTDIARDKDRLIADAVLRELRRKTKRPSKGRTSGANSRLRHG